MAVNLKLEMLKALREDDRAKGERIRALMLQEAARDFALEVERINRSFYRAWCDWDALHEYERRKPNSPS